LPLRVNAIVTADSCAGDTFRIAPRCKFAPLGEFGKPHSGGADAADYAGR